MNNFETIGAYRAELVEDPVVDRQQQVLRDKMIQKVGSLKIRKHR